MSDLEADSVTALSLDDIMNTHTRLNQIVHFVSLNKKLMTKATNHDVHSNTFSVIFLSTLIDPNE